VSGCGIESAETVRMKKTPRWEARFSRKNKV
jgi:hypothetical protein